MRIHLLVPLLVLVLPCACARSGDARLGELEKRISRLERQMEDRVDLRNSNADAGAPEVPDSPISIAGMPYLGSSKAPVVMIEFSDFQCPYCRLFSLTALPELKRDLIDQGKLRYVFYTMPLERIHSRAIAAAQMAYCAGGQGKFWAVHDRFFQDPSLLSSQTSDALVAELGLDRERFDDCLGGSEAVIRARISTARSLGVVSTPTFLLGRPIGDADAVRVLTRMRGMTEVAKFKEAFDVLLASAEKPR